MATPRHVVCPFCGRRTRNPDQHHPALAGNYPALVIDACRRCHNGRGSLTDRSFTAGMIHGHTASEQPARSSSERLWCFAQGSVDVMATIRRNLGTERKDLGAEADIRWIEGIGAAMLRLLWLSDVGQGSVPTYFGPQPAKNRRRWKRRPHQDPTIRRGGHHWSRVFALVRYLRATSATTAADLRAKGDEAVSAQQDRVTDALGHVLTHPRAFLRGVHRLSRAGLLDPLVDAAVECGSRVERLQVAVATADSPEDLLAPVTALMRVLVPVESMLLELLKALVDGTDPERQAKQFIAWTWETP